MVPFKPILAELGEEHAAAAQRIWESLLISAVHRAGGKIDSTSIRTTAELRSKDGGVDIFVDKPGNPDTLGLLKPGPTIYSVKSGCNAMKPRTLQKEFDEPKHTQLVSRVRQGAHYVYCVFADATQQAQAILMGKAAALCVKLGVPEGQISVAFHTAIERGLFAYPGVLQHHLPKLAATFGRPGQEWGRSNLIFDKKVMFAELNGRANFLSQLVAHIDGRECDPLIHVCGLSGIGKTRLVYEAVNKCGLTDSVLYRATPDGAESLLQFFIDNPTAGGVVVIDECSLGVRDEFRKLLADAANKDKTVPQRIRVVTIGPLMRNYGVTPPDIALPDPETEEDIVKVLQNAGVADLTEQELRELALDARHDIRLGLLFLKVRREGGPGSQGGSEIKRLLERVIGLFRPETQGATGFQEAFPYLSVLLTLGVSGPVRDEIEWLAKEFELSITRLDETLKVACNCGLGERGINLFEAVPRGLATRLFEEQCWPVIRNRLPDFLDRLPPIEARHAFLDRLDLCGPAVRNPAAEMLTKYCRSKLPDPDPRCLLAVHTRALVTRWLRLAPEAALLWLDHAIVPRPDTSDEDEAAMSRAAEPSQHMESLCATVRVLAAFPEHFHRAESILFAMTRHQAESDWHHRRERWSSLYRTQYSFTSVDFDTRLDTLIHRLREPATQDFTVIASGFLSVISSGGIVIKEDGRSGSLRAPPEKLLTTGEIYHRRSAAVKALIASLPVVHPAVAIQVRQWLVEHIAAAAIEAVIPDLRSALRPSVIGPEMALKLRISLYRTIQHWKEDAQSDGAAYFEALRQWDDELRPATFTDQMRQYLACDDFDFFTLSGRPADALTQREAMYDLLAPDIIVAPAILHELREALCSPDCRSGGYLAKSLGRLDTANAVEAEVKALISTHGALGFDVGYLNARKMRDGALPAWAIPMLDDAVSIAPQWAARVTSFVDETESGAERIIRCCREPGVSPGAAMRYIYQTRWLSILTPEFQGRLLDQIVADSGEHAADRWMDAINVLCQWYPNDKLVAYPEPIHDRARALATQARSLPGDGVLSNWLEVVKRVSLRDPGAMIDALLDRLFYAKLTYLDLCNRCARSLIEFDDRHSEHIADGFLRRLGDPRCGGPPLGELSPRLLERFPTRSLCEAISQRDKPFLRWICYLTPHPRAEVDGTPTIPTVTRWFLDTYGADEECFRCFMSGSDRPGCQMQTLDTTRHELASLESAFAAVPDPLIQRWLRSIKERVAISENSSHRRSRELSRD